MGPLNKNDTHRPRELKRDPDPAGLVDFIGVVLDALKRKHISTENLRWSGSKRAGAAGGDLHLVLFQAHFEVGVALVSSAAQVLGAPGAVAALPVRQLAVYIFHRDQLQLEIAGWLGHLETTRSKRPKLYIGPYKQATARFVLLHSCAWRRTSCRRARDA